jgi:hypothetical protein
LLQLLLLFLASTNEQMRETLAQLVYEALMGICLQMYDVELAARLFQETFNLVHLEENTIFSTYEEQNTLTLHFTCNKIDTLYNIAGKNFQPLNWNSIP